jgi:hypothetical protein
MRWRRTRQTRRVRACAPTFLWSSGWIFSHSFAPLGERTSSSDVLTYRRPRVTGANSQQQSDARPRPTTDLAWARAFLRLGVERARAAFAPAVSLRTGREHAVLGGAAVAAVGELRRVRRRRHRHQPPVLRPALPDGRLHDAAAAPRALALALPARAARLGFGRTVASETEVPNMLANLV